MKAIKLLSILLALGVLVFALTACEDNKPVEQTQETEVETNEVVTPEEETEKEILDGVPNPVIEYDSVEDAVIVVGHLNPLPSIYERYEQKASVISGTTIQIRYYDDEGEVLCIREKAGTETDISGNYNSYPYDKTIDIDGQAVTVKGESGDSIELVLWNDGAYAHSVNYNNGGHSLEEVKNVVNEING